MVWLSPLSCRRRSSPPAPDDTAGLVLSDIAPLVDRVYAVTTVDQIPALEAAVSAAGEDTDFVAELTATALM